MTARARDAYARGVANRASLVAVGAGSDASLVAAYSLPDGWLDLFAADDLYEGPRCALAGCTNEHTLSYLLCEAPVALARFRTRMERAKVPLTGNDTTAKLWRFFETHFARGHLFADTTELQWMNERTFVAGTRRALARAETQRKRVALRPETLLLEFGWGSGLSREEIAETITRARAAPLDTSAMKGAPYDPARRYAVGDAIAHRVFGEGTVRAINHSAMTVDFAIGTKTLAHAKPA